MFPKIYHTLAKHSIRFSLPTLINATQRNTAHKLQTHSFNSLIKYTKLKYIINYNLVCIHANCYVCGRDQ